MNWTQSGSSPHERGTRLRAVGRRFHRRFIPARAGNARRSSTRSIPATVHPRTGGERSASFMRTVACSGSSPHGRGTRQRGRLDPAPDRFIPARAGNADSRQATAGRFPVHPRTGGERRARKSFSPSIAGSSPHGRGTLAGVNSDRKFLICADRKFLTLSVRSFPQARCGGVGLGGAVGNWLGDATAHESGGDKPVIHSGRAARLLFRPAATTRPSCGGGPSRTAAGSGDPASCSCSLGC